MDAARLARILSALGSEPRLRIIASLQVESTHVSELARRLGMSRPLLYQHLNRLEAARLIESGVEQLGESRLRKHYWVSSFHLEVAPALIAALIDQEQERNSS
ncbi:ArsR family transcriptional regulator [Kocuria sp. ICS0012]|uniref:ArsR/SmtB family transcription factor n=1 Tax=Kocuria sp. ICS0012 TaxID=1834155 RepID=UPI0009EE8FA8|nr:ArsR family transcriptional regulator [Kocuria sp. ICS0012]